MHAISLPACKIHTIHRTKFVLALNDTENIHFSENIAIVRVSVNCVALPPPHHLNPKYRQLPDRGQPLDSDNRSRISYTIRCKELLLVMGKLSIIIDMGDIVKYR